MREEIVRCDQCGEIFEGDVLTLPSMVVKKWDTKTGKKDNIFNSGLEKIVLSGLEASEKEEPPDFCGLPCMLKWISKRLTGGIKNGTAK